MASEDEATFEIHIRIRYNVDKKELYSDYGTLDLQEAVDIDAGNVISDHSNNYRSLGCFINKNDEVVVEGKVIKE